jgi:glutathione S-transferase
MKLFYMPGACSLAPHITLEWIGKPFEVVRIELGKTHDPEYLKINPLGKVPALINEEGKLMVEASAILLYLAEKFPEANLGYGNSPEQRYELNRWMSHFTGNVHPAFFPFFAPQRFTKNTDDLGSVREAGFEGIDRSLSFLEEHMRDRNYVLGDSRTIADPYLFVFLRWGNHLPKPLSDYPNLHRFFHQMAEDAGIKRAMAEQAISL